MAFGAYAPFPRRLGGSEPSASKWARYLAAQMGSALEGGELVSAENIALARMIAAGMLSSEKLVKNTVPTTAYEGLRDWAKRLGIVIRDGDTAADVRRECEARYAAQVGPTITAVDAALEKLLSSALIATVTFTGTDLDNPPDFTYWDGINPGSSDFDLGGDANGMWSSVRAHLLISVEQPGDMSADDFAYLINVRLYELLDRMLPAWVTFDWVLGAYDGFQLDVDKLDYDAL